MSLCESVAWPCSFARALLRREDEDEEERGSTMLSRLSLRFRRGARPPPPAGGLSSLVRLLGSCESGVYSRDVAALSPKMDDDQPAEWLGLLSSESRLAGRGVLGGDGGRRRACARARAVMAMRTRFGLSSSWCRSTSSRRLGGIC